MDYDELLQHLGELGPYQKKLLFLSMVPIVYNAFGGPVSIFLMGEHPHRYGIYNGAQQLWCIQWTI